jgi:uncharacterized protein YecE (DUF72 family)
MVYPAHLRERDMLGYYLHTWQFNALEWNVTFYRVPDEAQCARFAARLPPAFALAVKAHRDITHRPLDSATASLCTAFRAALAPLRTEHKLACVLLQFPYAFHDTAKHREHVRVCRAALSDLPLAVEFRHDSWNTVGTAAFLRKLAASFCAVDEPALTGLIPWTDFVTASLGYVRLHGRNRAWFTAGAKERYNYDYREVELQSLLQRIRIMAGATQKIFIFFNNCYMGRAVKNALAFRDMLQSAS